MSAKKNTVFSGALFLENLKRFWAVGAVAFLFYFLSVPFMILRYGNDLAAYEVRQIFGATNVGCIMLVVTMPIAASLLVFSYLHKNNSVNTLHAMPFSRISLFVTNYLSGLALIVLPLLINAIIALALRRPITVQTYDPITDTTSQYLDSTVYTVGLVLGWLKTNVISLLFTYALSVLAAVISGTTIIHFLTCYGLNGVLPLLYVCSLFYAQQYLYGYVTSGAGLGIIRYMHPLGSLFSYLVSGESAWKTQILWDLYYLAVAVAVSALALILYRKRKMERAGDSYVFAGARWAIFLVLVFLSTTFFGALFSLFGVNGKADFWGYAAGFVIGFIISLMIVRKSFSIFNRKIFKPLLISFAVAALFMAAFSFDVLGIEKRVPKAEDVKSVQFRAGWVPTSELELSETANIEGIVDFHRTIVADKAELKHWEKERFSIDTPQSDEYYKEAISVNLYYDLKNGKSLTRSYVVPAKLFAESEGLKLAYESAESRRGLDILRQADPAGFSGEIHLIDPYEGEVPDEGEVSDRIVYPSDKPPAVYDSNEFYYDTYYDVALLSAALREELRDALIADIEAISFEDVVEAGRRDYYFKSSVTLVWKDPRLPEVGGYGQNVNNTFMGYLWAHNYFDSFDSDRFLYVDCNYNVDLFNGLFPKTDAVLEKVRSEATPVTVAY